MALYLLVDSHEPTRRILRRKLLAAGQDVQKQDQEKRLGTTQQFRR